MRPATRPDTASRCASIGRICCASSTLAAPAAASLRTASALGTARARRTLRLPARVARERVGRGPAARRRRGAVAAVAARLPAPGRRAPRGGLRRRPALRPGLRIRGPRVLDLLLALRGALGTIFLAVLRPFGSLLLGVLAPLTPLLVEILPMIHPV